MMTEQMKFIESQVKNTENEIKRVMDGLHSPITTIPGIGKVMGAVILGELGDISSFDNPSKIVAYASIDASVSQSGESASLNNKMSKRVSPYLRKALYQTATVAAFNDAKLSAFYQKKIAESKHHKTAIGAVERKLCYIIFAIPKDNRPYIER